MPRWLALVPTAFLVALTVVAVSRAPRVDCSSLPAEACFAATRAIATEAESRKGIVRIGLVGYRGCPPLPILCQVGGLGGSRPLNALAGVEYEDGTKLAFSVADLDQGGRIEVSRMEDLEDYVTALVLPKR
jgi:hypothetical protein